MWIESYLTDSKDFWKNKLQVIGDGGKSLAHSMNICTNILSSMAAPVAQATRRNWPIGGSMFCLGLSTGLGHELNNYVDGLQVSR
jgi:hypothetical protein